jgi:tRNA uridine 5-carboxymethylaminomethyl modification enzyme
MKFNIIVIGGGHAGIEAAHIAAKKKLSVLLISSHLDLIGQMSCNPSIGGIAKGTIVREIDALGGLMARIIDRAGIHFRMLNRSKGMAVWGPRAQADKALYRRLVKAALEKHPEISMLQGLVREIRVNSARACGIVMDSSERIDADAIVLCAGTFLNGKMHIGLTSFPAGRNGEPPAVGLTEGLREAGIASGRLKTGTSPRIDGRTVDFSKLSPQPGDEDPWPFSFCTHAPIENKTNCWITRSNQRVHDIIRRNLDRSPLYTGRITSRGPRYCPSIEDKVVRFGDRDGHMLFLEPEGIESAEMYLNGLSTSLPADVQEQMVKSIPGLENARILRPGYGIEYDYFQPRQLRASLESKFIENLFFAGQVNGTSGYEEAACQGCIAGANAAAKILGEEALVLGRDTSYIGVLIDDLVTKGTEEPYRMFTSRAEYRLLLRQDNADERLMPIAHERGFISSDEFDARRAVWDQKRAWKEELARRRIDPEAWKTEDEAAAIDHPSLARELLTRPQVSIEQVLSALGEQIESRDVRLGVEADIKYRGFVAKQEAEIMRQRSANEMRLPEEIDYLAIPELSVETQGKLAEVRPKNLGQASRIPGITPADISVLLIYIGRK